MGATAAALGKKIDERIKDPKGLHGEAEMRIMFCRKYNRYVSQRHCEFFNEGDSCKHHEAAYTWRSIKDLMRDEHRPLWNLSHILKPFNCTLMDQLHLHAFKRQLRHRRRVMGARG